jgi:hypothetical protein
VKRSVTHQYDVSQAMGCGASTCIHPVCCDKEATMSNLIEWCLGVLHWLARYLLEVLLPAFIEHKLGKPWIVIVLVMLLIGVTLYCYFYWR